MKLLMPLALIGLRGVHSVDPNSLIVRLTVLELMVQADGSVLPIMHSRQVSLFLPVAIASLHGGSLARHAQNQGTTTEDQNCAQKVGQRS